MRKKPWIRQLIAFNKQAKQMRDSNKSKESTRNGEVSVHLERSFSVLRHQPFA